MNVGELLVAKGLISGAEIKRALEHQTHNGGRLGDSIAALGLLTKEQIDKVLDEAPQAPLTAAATGLDPVAGLGHEDYAEVRARFAPLATSSLR